MQTPLPLVLMILDGFGYSGDTTHNAIAQANTPQWDDWWRTAPHTLLCASGQTVGLPETQMGNSEVGHMHIGAGRRVMQDLTRINHAIASGEFDTQTIFLDTFKQLNKTKKNLHVMGLLSDGGVHSHEEHLFTFLKLCAKNNFKSVVLHLFLDGRDTSPQSALASLKRLEAILNETHVATLQSITGRYYALDRDNRWERIEPVYRLLTEEEQTTHVTSAEEAVKAYYAEGIFDEFIPPTQLRQPCPIQDGDAIFFFNFRADRARQLTQAFLDPNFEGFSRKKCPNLTCFISMTRYAERLDTTPVFPPFCLKHTLGEVLSEHGLRQLRIAETEKYAHVTFFLNGGSEPTFPGEERILIPSPKVATYDMQPEMSAKALTKTILHAIHHNTHDVIICNYANADMVGHTGNFEAAVQAIECLDHAMHAIGDALKTVQGQLLITADHGNAESMFDSGTQLPHTAHTHNLVPLLYVGKNDWQFTPNTRGSLTDIAPTLLTLLNINPPTEMSGHALLTRGETR
jgi:2,3-bisphosphoglycerate-independent phosphoglycerate mutase